MHPHRVVEVDREDVADWSLLERRVLAWNTAFHIVRARDLAVELEKPDPREYLYLGIDVDRVPLLRRAHGRHIEGFAGDGHGPRKVDAIGLNAIPAERRHGNAPVFYLRVPQESDGFLLALAPKARICEPKGVVKADDWVQLLRKRFDYACVGGASAGRVGI